MTPVPFYKNPLYITLFFTFVLNGAYAILKAFQSSIDPQTLVMANLILAYVAQQAHVSLVNQSVASATQSK